MIYLLKECKLCHAYNNIDDENAQIMGNQMDQEDLDHIQNEVQDEQIVPNSKPPEVPEDGTYIDALNEAGVDQKRIEQLQQSK